MSNYVYDGTTGFGSISGTVFPKADLNPIGGGDDPVKWSVANDWNIVAQAVTDIRDALRQAVYYGFAEQVSDPAPSGYGGVSQPGYLWINQSDHKLHIKVNGVDTALGGSALSGTANTIVKFTSPSTGGNSSMTDSGTLVSINNPVDIVTATSPGLQLRASGVSPRVVFSQGDPAIQFWKDGTPTNANGIGLCVPLTGSPSNDLVFSAFDSSTWFEGMRMKHGSGVVSLGINDSGPTHTLDVSGAGLRLKNGANATIKVRGGGNNLSTFQALSSGDAVQLYMQYIHDNASMGARNDTVEIGSAANYPIHLRPGDNETMVLYHTGGFQMPNGTTGVSAANTGRMRYNSGSQHFEFSENGGAYFTISSGLTGSGATGGVTFWTTASNISADATKLFWDNTTKRLGIGNAAPTKTLDVTGDVLITGKLTVTGAIDPTSLTLDAGGSNNAYLENAAGQSAGNAPANRGRLRYNATSQTWEASENNTAAVPVVKGSVTANQVQVGSSPNRIGGSVYLTYDNGTPGKFALNSETSTGLSTDKNSADLELHANFFDVIANDTKWALRNVSDSLNLQGVLTFLQDGVSRVTMDQTLGLAAPLATFTNATITNTFTGHISASGVILFESDVLLNSSFSYPAGRVFTFRATNVAAPNASARVLSVQQTSGTETFAIDPFGTFEMNSGTSSTVSAASRGKLRYNASSQTFQMSMNGAAYVDIGSGSGLSGGTTNRLVKWTSGTTVGNSVWSDDSITTTYTQTAASSGNVSALVVVCGAHTGQTATVETTDIDFQMNRTVQLSGNNTTLAANRAALFRAPNYVGTNNNTITEAATVAITGAPTQGTQAHLTNRYALWVQSQWSQFAGPLAISAASANPDSSTTGTGATVFYLAGTNTTTGTTATQYLVSWNQNAFNENAQGQAGIWALTGGAITKQFTSQASDEVFDIVWNLSRTVQFKNNNSAGQNVQRAFVITPPTYAFDNTDGFLVEAATMAISGAPVAGTNCPITNSYAFWVQAGLTKLGGSVDIAASGNAAFAAWRAGQSAAVSAASTGRIRYNATTNHLQFSENGGAYVDFVTSSGSVGSTVSELQLTTTGATTVATFTPASQSNYGIEVYYRVVTATTNVTVTVTWTDTTGAQTSTILTTTAQAVGSYSLPPLFINATAAAITVTATAGTANQVFVSASIRNR